MPMTNDDVELKLALLRVKRLSLNMSVTTMLLIIIMGPRSLYSNG